MRLLYGPLRWEPLSPLPRRIIGKLFADDNTILPWFTYAASAQLLRWGLAGERVLEFGAGSSTLFWLDQGAQVWSMEHDPSWGAWVKAQIPADLSSNIHLEIHRSSSTYVPTLQRLREIKPSVIVVDGIHRREACCRIVELVDNTEHQDGPTPWLVVLDNSDWHGASYQELQRSKRLIPLDYYGHGPSNSYAWCTTLFINLHHGGLIRHIERLTPAKPMANGLVDHWDENL